MEDATISRTVGFPTPSPVDAPVVGRLMALVADGDVSSFAALYDVLAPYVCQLAGALSVDEHVREQVASAAFTTIWRTARSCPTDGDEALAWTMDIAYQQALACSSATPGTGRWILGERSATLTSGQRASTALTCGGALTYRQVADLIGEPAHTVALLQRDALIRLRDATATRPGPPTVAKLLHNPTVGT